MINTDMQNILNQYSGKIEVIENIEPLLDNINERFSWVGSKIDKSKTSNHISYNINRNDNWGREAENFILNNNLENKINSLDWLCCTKI